jgi:hypothetical protein
MRIITIVKIIIEDYIEFITCIYVFINDAVFLLLILFLKSKMK